MGSTLWKGACCDSHTRHSRQPQQLPWPPGSCHIVVACTHCTFADDALADCVMGIDWPEMVVLATPGGCAAAYAARGQPAMPCSGDHRQAVETGSGSLEGTDCTPCCCGGSCQVMCTRRVAKALIRGGGESSAPRGKTGVVAVSWCCSRQAGQSSFGGWSMGLRQGRQA